MDGRMDGWKNGWMGRRTDGEVNPRADAISQPPASHRIWLQPNSQPPAGKSIKKEKDENSQHHELIFRSNPLVFRKIYPCFLPNRIRLHIMKESA